jgi:gamma-glutamyltranspeptidase/glutathione hydrolase
MRLGEVLQYAIGYAESGYPILPQIAAVISIMERLFREEWTSSAAMYLAGGSVPRAGGKLRNQALAATWTRLLAESETASKDRDAQVEAARGVFYQGFVAEAIDRFSRGNEVMDLTGRRHRGLLTGEDLVRWKAGLEEPVTFDYRGVRVCKTGPWGQGPVFLQQLSLLAGLQPRSDGYGSADYIHTVVECAKLAFADREAWYGDPAFVQVPLDGLLDPAYAADRRALVGEQASRKLRPGGVGGGAPRLPPMVLEAPDGADRWLGMGDPTMVAEAAAHDTCHVDVADRFGGDGQGRGAGDEQPDQEPGIGGDDLLQCMVLPPAWCVEATMRRTGRIGVMSGSARLGYKGFRLNC